MTRRTGIALGLLALVVLLVVAVWLWPGHVTSPVRAAPAPLPPAAPLFTGTASCSGRACHGSVEPGPGGDPLPNEGSYTLWITHDRHARAYEVLLGDEGRAIGERLGIAHPEASERCLACHTNPAVAADNTPPALAEERRFGVGCEACHGAAQDWLEPHRSKEWKDLQGDDVKLKKKYDGTKMTWLRTPGARASVCAGCHVGDAAGDGRPARDVNHDLIAAGHPRLAFEYSTYLANMPHHWQEKAPVANEALAWAVGQVTSAAADMTLLASRAGDKGQPWPEFAAYDCSSCHHDLRDSDWRRSRAGNSPPGSFRPSSWYGALWPLAVPQLLADGAPRPATGPLRAELARPRPDRDAVAAQARAAAGQLSDLAKQLDRLDLKPEQVKAKALRDALARHGANARDADWDELEQTALALLAVNRAVGDPGADEAARKLVQQLAYPVGYHTPKQFRTQKEFDADLKKLFQQISP
jgi:hypothetical protein